MSKKFPDKVALSCSIYYAEGIDRDVTAEERHYFVVLWVEPGRECSTSTSRGIPDPGWKQSFYMVLDRPADCKFLFVEVRRKHLRADRPGTSKREATVGRARIPLPENFMVMKQGRFGLVNLDGMEVKGEGHIVLSMVLQKF